VTLTFSAVSDRGLRDANEDAYCTEHIGNFSVFAVADGLGGHHAGEVASGIAIECLKNAMKLDEGNQKETLQEAVENAHRQILAQGERNPEKGGMATTLIAACVDDDLNCTVINVGDSRAHFITTDHVTTTKDHSYVNELVAAGEIRPEDAWQHPLSNVLSQALGDPDSDVKPDFYEANLNDTFLLLSTDGLHDFVRKEKIWDIVLSNGNNLKKAVSELVKEALSAGSDDNITLVLLHGGP